MDLRCFCLLSSEQTGSDYSLNFEGFSFFVKAFLLQLLIGIKVFLWTLLFIVPGIVAGYRYSQAFYILADNPDYSVTQCVEEKANA